MFIAFVSSVFALTKGADPDHNPSPQSQIETFT